MKPDQREIGDDVEISIVMAVYNGAATLQRCIDSIAAQTYPHYELILIDGASTDGTMQIIKKNQAKITYWESKPDRGIYHAWNKALEHVHGDWICFLGADDYFWSPDVLEHMVPYLDDSLHSPMVVYGQLAIMNGDNELLYMRGKPWDQSRRNFKSAMTIPHLGTMHHRRLFEQYGIFDESFRIAGDYEMLLRALRNEDALYVPGLIVVGMQVGGGVSSDPRQTLLSLQEVRQAHKKWLNGKSGWFWWYSYAKVKLRILLWRVCGESAARKMLDLARMCMGKPKHWTRT